MTSTSYTPNAAWQAAFMDNHGSNFTNGRCRWTIVATLGAMLGSFRPRSGTVRERGMQLETGLWTGGMRLGFGCKQASISRTDARSNFTVNFQSSTTACKPGCLQGTEKTTNKNQEHGDGLAEVLTGTDLLPCGPED